MQRQTDRQTDSQTYRHTDRQPASQQGRHTHTHTHRTNKNIKSETYSLLTYQCTCLIHATPQYQLHLYIVVYMVILPHTSCSLA